MHVRLVAWVLFFILIIIQQKGSASIICNDYCGERNALTRKCYASCSEAKWGCYQQCIDQKIGDINPCVRACFDQAFSVKPGRHAS